MRPARAMRRHPVQRRRSPKGRVALRPWHPADNRCVPCCLKASAIILDASRGAWLACLQPPIASPGAGACPLSRISFCRGQASFLIDDRMIKLQALSMCCSSSKMRQPRARRTARSRSDARLPRMRRKLYRMFQNQAKQWPPRRKLPLQRSLPHPPLQIRWAEGWAFPFGPWLHQLQACSRFSTGLSSTIFCANESEMWKSHSRRCGTSVILSVVFSDPQTMQSSCMLTEIEAQIRANQGDVQAFQTILLGESQCGSTCRWQLYIETPAED